MVSFQNPSYNGLPKSPGMDSYSPWSYELMPFDVVTKLLEEEPIGDKNW